MSASWKICCCLCFLLLPFSCTESIEQGEGPDEEEGTNPFLEDNSNPGKEDTGYVNPDGIEIEVDIEADVEAASYRIFDAPAELGQYALTYLRKTDILYLESLAEDATSDRRVEWLVDEEWLTAQQARELSTSQLRHFRIRGINAVLLHGDVRNAEVGRQFTARVPVNPYSAYTEGGAACTDPDSHMGLSSSIYWYLWNPDKSGCQATTQEMTITVSAVLPSSRPVYPEYDQLTADNQLTVVILFGQIGDDPLTDSDSGVRNLTRFAKWLTDADFEEVTPAPVGRRFQKEVEGIDVVMDLYSPYDFSGLGDFAHFSNFQRALSEHEIVAYDGHSMLGASDFWSRPEYPDFYQIYLYGGCLGYEYYVRPILSAKGGWDKVDILSSVIEVSASANDFAAPFLSKLMWALENGYNASWTDLIAAVRRRVGDSTFGVSGARENCFSPSGSQCGDTPADPGDGSRYENTSGVDIPDNNSRGVSSTVTISDTLVPGELSLELDISHTWVGDLYITVSHNNTNAVVWNRTGGSNHDIRQTFALDDFEGNSIAGTWTLTVVDRAASDTGRLNRWAVIAR
ncbi:MAG: proprotein convertase P-domain-containing protein [Bradymonadales bacterium]|nr:proprotein convertase P-domain-containing protein [Bradymonadales bacterium]